MNFEELKAELTKAQADGYIKELTNTVKGYDQFERLFTFITCTGLTVKVTWYSNVIYIQASDHCFAILDELKIINTWPNGAIMNLQGYKENNTCLVIELKK